MEHGNPMHLLGAAVLAAHAIEFLKRSGRLPWINNQTDRLNRIVAYAVAAANTAGFRFAFTGDWTSGAGLHLDLPPVSQLIDMLCDFGGAFGGQEFYYRAVIKSGNGKRVGTGTVELAQSILDKLQAKLKQKEKGAA